MDQEPYFCLEARSRISWFEVECNLANDVAEIPCKRKLDPITAHGRNVVPFPPVGPPPAFGASVFACGVTLASVGALTLGVGATFPFVGVARAGVFGAGLALGSGISL